MPDRVSQAALDEDAAPDWRAAAPGLELRSIAAVALTVPLLLAAGVYWLHQLPVGPNLRTNDSVVEVRLLGPQGQAPEPQDVPTSSAQQREPPPPETSMKDPTRTIPDTAVASLPSRPEQAAAASPAAATSSAPPISHIALEQKAAVFQRTLLSHIARYRRYPEGARRERAQGVVRLLFSMKRDGTVIDVRVVSSSGYALLDTAAIETIRNAQPMPRIPAELPEHLNITMPVAFDLPQ